MPEVPLGDQPHPRAPLPDAWWTLQLRTRRIIAATIAALLVGGLGSLAVWLLDSEPSIDPAQAEAEAYVAKLPPARVAAWDQLAECESEGDWDAATGNGFEGGLQFTQSSWVEAGGVGSPAAASREEQIMRGQMLYEIQGYAAWPSCSAQLGLDN